MNKRNSKLSHRLLAAILALAMIISLFPATALAAEMDEELIPAAVEVEEIMEEEAAPAEEVTEEEEAAPAEAEETIDLAPQATDTSFELWFNPNGSTAIAQGQQGNLPVYAGENMAAKSNPDSNAIQFLDKETKELSTYFSVQGSTNPSPSKGAVPTAGAYLRVVAPADGVVTVYGIANSKAFYIVKGDGTPVFSHESLTFPNNEPYALEVSANDDLYYYAQGSKAQFVGVVFEEGKTLATSTAPRPYKEEKEIEEAPVEYGKWEFGIFGPSTNKSYNTVAEGADIKDKVTMTSCNFKEDGAINSKGGKMVADSPADGLSFYYTVIDPTKTNFKLMADVTIDYQNPALDGQEGFALMVRDTIAGSGATSSHMSNQASVVGTKLPVDKLNGSVQVKDVVGTRNYTGIVDPEDASKNKVVPYLQGFTGVDENGEPDATAYYAMEKGKTYRVSLEKTAYGYVSTYYDMETGAVLGQYTLYIGAKDSAKQTVSSYAELDDPMMAQKADAAYVGFAVARGCNATFSNISYTTSEWKAGDWKPQPTVKTDLTASITSPSTVAEDSYSLVFKANADGKADIYQNGTLVDEQVAITGGVPFTKGYAVTGDTVFTVRFTPNADFRFGTFEILSSYETVESGKTVSMRKLGDTIYVAPNGKAENGGTSFTDAVDIFTAVQYVSAGQTICLKAGEYDLSGKELLVERGRDGSEAAPITMTTDGGYATLNFGRTGRGFTLWGSWWHISFLNVCYSTNGVKGMQVAGHNNIVERCNFYNNGNTGLQISGTASETKAQWPSNNLILNCTSINNSDKGYEDADGFAAKLTVGDGNVFDGCIAAYNADDGWDFFAKAASGSIGMVTIQNSAAYRNGYIWAKVTSEDAISEFAAITCDKNGTLTIDKTFPYVNAGNGNGFKMGGTNLPGGHTLKNSISWENKAKGIDSNSCPDIKAYNSTSYNNENYNIAMYTNNKTAKTGYAAEGVISYRKDTDGKEQFTIQEQAESVVKNATTFLWDNGMSRNTAEEPVTVADDWFISLDTSVEPTRFENGTINMHGLLLLTEKGLMNNAGARGEKWVYVAEETPTKPEEKPTQPEEKPTKPTKPVVPAKPVLKASKSTKGVSLSWNAVANATEYQVYRKTESGSYQKVKTTKAISWVDTSVKTGAEYQYKVIAVNGTVKGAASDVKSVVYVAPVIVTYVKRGPKKTIKIKWEKNSGVTAYQIQYSTVSSFKKSKTITMKGAKKVYKKTKSLKKNKKYYVRIRAYKTVKGKKYYSAWSKTLSVKTK